MEKKQTDRNILNGLKALLIFSISSITSVSINYLGVGKESIIMVFLLGVLCWDQRMVLFLE